MNHFRRRLVVPSLIWAIAGMTIAGRGLAQTLPDPQVPDSWDLPAPPAGLSPTTLQPAAPALGMAIDPGSYRLGPSDLLAVNVWTTPPLTMNVAVTPEGSLLLPSMGEVVVKDVPLTRAREKVIALIRRKVRDADITVTLLRPRNVHVRVQGQVAHPGSYTLSAADRVDRALEEANRPLRGETADDLAMTLAEMSTRSVSVLHADGTRRLADLPMFFATQADSLNPYLRGGDVITVPRREHRRWVIGVYGEVNAPGRFEFVEGDSLVQVVQMAQGWTPLALSNRAELYRLDATGDSIVKSIVDLPAMVAGETPNLALQPGDRVLFRPRDDRREDFRVYVSGEVFVPGVYPITRGATRLSEVLRRSGGPTPDAALQSAQLVRRTKSDSEISYERMESLRGGVGPDDSAYYLLETNLRLAREVVVVDFERLIIDGDTSQDVVLRSEDWIHLPSAGTTIYVFGQVVTPGHVPFLHGAGVEYYLRKAGGVTEKARPGDVRVVKAKTKQWLLPEETDIESGDYIWVPRDPDRPFGYYLNIVAQTASILSLALSVVLLVVQINK